MLSYLFKRLLSLIPLVLGVTFLVFALMSATPGDFLTAVKANRDVSQERIAAMEEEFGLNDPFYVQYGAWLGNVVRGNLGYSWTYKMDVAAVIGQRFVNTLILAVATALFAWGVAVPLGVFTAMKKGTSTDRGASIVAYAVLSVPQFVLGLIAVYFAARTGWFPIGGATSVGHEFLPWHARILDTLHHLALPVFVLGIGYVGYYMRIMRSNFLDSMAADYVRTARAKGLDEGTVMFKHVLRNAINPMISIFGLSFSYLLSGSLIVEIVFSYPGLGNLIYTALISEDQFLVLGAVTMSCVLLIGSNLTADLALAWSDPRIRLEGGGKQ